MINSVISFATACSCGACIAWTARTPHRNTQTQAETQNKQQRKKKNTHIECETVVRDGWVGVERVGVHNLHRHRIVWRMERSNGRAYPATFGTLVHAPPSARTERSRSRPSGPQLIDGHKSPASALRMLSNCARARINVSDDLWMGINIATFGGARGGRRNLRNGIGHVIVRNIVCGLAMFWRRFWR